MKRNTISLLVLILIGGLYSMTLKVDKIPITTTSETARTLYSQAWDSLDEFKWNQAQKLLHKAVEEDNDFFMANFMLGMLNFNNKAKFKQFGERVINCNVQLSKGELLLKDAMSKLLDNPKSDLTDIGKKLVKLYPSDALSYYQLSFYQGLINDIDGQIATLKSATENVEEPANFYNQLGYVNMRNGRFKEAEIAFNRYIEQAPNLPNAYDSKGEYFLTVQDYQNAYECYMKAYNLDSQKPWRLNRAIKAELEMFRIDHKKAIDTKDIEGILQFYSDNLITNTAEEPIKYGNEWIKPLLEQLYRDYEFHEDFELSDIRVIGEHVAASLTFTQTMVAKTDGTSITQTGKGMCVLKKSEDGIWQFEWNTYHYNVSE